MINWESVTFICIMSFSFTYLYINKKNSLPYNYIGPGEKMYRMVSKKEAEKLFDKGGYVIFRSEKQNEPIEDMKQKHIKTGDTKFTSEINKWYIDHPTSGKVCFYILDSEGENHVMF